MTGKLDQDIGEKTETGCKLAQLGSWERKSLLALQKISQSFFVIFESNER